uniref:Uncharacterized protein n=1 Tax=Panagrellus redivivus TaxID=6233 RepID=A0A7E4W5J4_PANRE
MPPQSNQTNKQLWASALLHESNTRNYPDVNNLLDTLAEVTRKWTDTESELKKTREKLRLAELKLNTTSSRGGKPQKDIQLETAREQITILIKKNAEMKTENSKLKRMISSIQVGSFLEFI